MTLHCALALMTSTWPAWAQAPTPTGPQTLDEVRQALLATPATVDNHEQRCALLAALDTFLEQPDSERSDVVPAYYQAMIDHALDEIASDTVEEGVVICKLYSSAMVIKTPRTVFGIDLDEGPNSSSGGPDKVAGLDGITFHMTADQRTRLAELVDVSFHTHRHHDHVNYQITQELIKAGKTVVVPGDIRDMWAGEPFASSLTVLDAAGGEKHDIDDLTVEVLTSRQWMAADHTVQCPCNAYLVTTDNGINVFTKGDINDGSDILPWLGEVKARGEGIDLYVSSLGFWWGKDGFPQIQRLFDPLLVPGHEYEFTHRKPGESGSGTGSYGSYCKRFDAALRRGKAVILSWGERFHYLPDLHRAGKSPLVWMEIDPQPREVEVRVGESFRIAFNASADGVEIKRWYIAFSKTDEVRNLPGFDEREWGGIIHDPDKDGVFKVSTENWPPGAYVLTCTVDDWPDGATRTSETIEVTVLPAGH